MQVKVKRIDRSLPLPIYETQGSVGFDILCRKDTTINPGEIKLIPGNIILKVPSGYMLLIACRSSTPSKKGLLMPHGIGILDQDYCGVKDELKIQMYNFKDKPVEIKKGEKIAQGLFVRIDQVNWKEVNSMGESRGGFGSTDKLKNRKTEEQ